MQTLLYQAGLDIEKLHFTRFKWKSVIFVPLWPFIWLARQLTMDRHSGQAALFGQGEHALNRWLTHPALLYSEQLFVIARRRG